MSKLPPTRHGHEAFEAISSLQKAIRRSDPEAAAYWAYELVGAGFKAWVFKRFRIIVQEDVSPEATGLVADLRALQEMAMASKENGPFEAVNAAVRLALAPKNRISDWLFMELGSADCPKREIPDHALDVHTARGKAMGRRWPHFFEESGQLIQWDGDLDELSAEIEARVARLPEWS